jgi:fermentation-respiration switch protein FrsA (DUF1100 family)
MATQKFDFQGSTNLSLSGRVDLPDAPARGWALFAHCFTCGKDGLAGVRVSRALAAAGIGVLRFDFAGIGSSAGDFAETTFASNVEDLLQAGRAMTAEGMPPTILIGHSFGGAAVLAAAAQLPTVRAVATIGAPFDTAHVLEQLGHESLIEIEQSGEADVRLGGKQLRFGRGFIDDVRQQDQASRIGHLGRALLVLHAPGDEVVGIEHAGKIFTAAKHPKSFVSLDDADHLLNRRADAEYVGNLIACWVSRYLPPAEDEQGAQTPPAS